MLGVRHAHFSISFYPTVNPGERNPHFGGFVGLNLPNFGNTSSKISATGGWAKPINCLQFFGISRFTAHDQTEVRYNHRSSFPHPMGDWSPIASSSNQRKLMNPQDRQKLERQLQELEAQIQQPQPLQTSTPDSPSLKSVYQQLTLWYQGLPNGGKVVAIAVGGVLALSAVSMVLNLLRLAFTLAAVGVLGFVGYKLFLASKSSNPNP